MKRWRTKLLGEVCAINPKLVASETPAADALVTFVPMAAVDEVIGSIARPELRKYSQVAKGYTPFRENDVLFAKITPCMQNGKAAIARNLCDGLGFGSTEFHVLRPTPRLLPQWVFAFLRQPSFRSAAEASFTGTAGQQRVPVDFLKQFPIPVPPLAEQERIVKLLDEADELRKLRAQADRRTADLIPALFHEMFGDPTDNPRGWPTQPVSSFVVELQGGRNVNPAGADEAAGRFRVLKVSAVTWGDFQPDESKPVPADYEPPSSHFVRAGDLLFSRANTTELVAATTYVFDTPPNLLLPDKLWRFVWKKPRIVEPLFVWWLFQAASVRRELGIRATGTSGSMKNISKPKVMTLEVPVPPLPRQGEFSRRVTEIRELEAEQTASRRRLDDLFQSLLHRAFTGELTQATAVTEPARTASSESVFLRRGAIASYIVGRLHSKPTFGRVQLAKLLFLTEAHVGIDLEGHYKRQAAGPLDAALLDNLEAMAKEEAWFTKHARAGDKAGYSYSPGASIAERQAAAVPLLGERQAEMDRLLAHVSRMRTEQAEIFATLFAAWNDFLLRGTTTSDDQIIREVRENWHSKKARFAPGRLANALAWMRKHSFTPRGIGPATAAAP